MDSMPTILLHSSKTMRPPQASSAPYQQPAFLADAQRIMTYLQSLSADQVGSSMKLPPALAAKTHALIADWTSDPAYQQTAIDAFLGDIYSGLQAAQLTDADRAYANEHLLILSGLYGALRALDSIHPYRLEMGYRLPDEPFNNLYRYWGERIAQLLPDDDFIINLSAVEYTKAVLPHVQNTPVISPKFLTRSQKTGQPTFVTVHAKIARGAFAHWLIRERIQAAADVLAFSDLGYAYDPDLSTPQEPAFVCETFQGTGLSVRRT